MVRQLRPWHYNTKKRLIKSPKIYFRDSGIFHALLSLENKKDVLLHPKLGASWEGFALEESIRRLGLDPATARLPGDAKTIAFSLRRGSARVVVAVHDTAAGGALRVVAPVVRIPADAASATGLYRRILELNGRELHGAAFGIFGDDVVAILERTLVDLDASEVEAAIRGVGAIADKWDDTLAKEFGTKRSSDG